jgi:hypothetical protein
MAHRDCHQCTTAAEQHQPAEHRQRHDQPGIRLPGRRRAPPRALLGPLLIRRWRLLPPLGRLLWLPAGLLAGLLRRRWIAVRHVIPPWDARGPASAHGMPVRRFRLPRAGFVTDLFGRAPDAAVGREEGPARASAPPPGGARRGATALALTGAGLAIPGPDGRRGGADAVVGGGVHHHRRSHVVEDSGKPTARRGEAAAAESAGGRRGGQLAPDTSSSPCPGSVSRRYRMEDARRLRTPPALPRHRRAGRSAVRCHRSCFSAAWIIQPVSRGRPPRLRRKWWAEGK